MTENANMLAAGNTLQSGKFRIEKCLSQGDNNFMYLARDVHHGNTVVVKEFFVHGINSRDADRRMVTLNNAADRDLFETRLMIFQREAKLLNDIDHDNIVRVHDWFNENGTSYYIMDYVDGTTLDVIVNRSGAINELQLRGWTPQLLDALEEIHKRRILHLAISPKNIVLDRRGNLQLTDFGSSMQLPSGDSEILANEDFKPAVPEFAAPEQISDRFGSLGTWTDLYSLGATLYFLITGKLPPSASDIVSNKTEKLQFPQTLGIAFRSFIEWLLQTDSKSRPNSIEQVKQYLDRVNNPNSDRTLGTPLPNMPQWKAQQEPEDEDEISQPGVKVKTRQPAGKSPKKNVSDKGQDGKEGGPNMKVLIAAVAALIVVAAVVLFMLMKSGNENNESQVASTPETSTQVQEPTTTIEGVAKSVTGEVMGEVGDRFSYTGQINSEGQPHGRGEAKYDDGTVYNGGWLNGKWDGDDCDMTIPADGALPEQHFRGTMRNDEYANGRITFGNDKSYYEGTFKNNAPLDGAYYNADGSVRSKVVAGKETNP